ncbi:MAG: glucose/mannose-6-phosphate isomerase [Saprospiraceae bacterium]|jgi:glucose/mannose-6-phosphate isomerase
MKKYIQDFTKQLNEAVEIGNNTQLKAAINPIHNIIICGIGGSGIGGRIISNLTRLETKIPVATCNEYDIPSYVNENTLVIASSYSGNTEEVLSMIKQAVNANAQIACITSGGELLDLAVDKGYNYIKIPGGSPPRACLGYSFTQLLTYFCHYKIIDNKALKELQSGIDLLIEDATEIETTAGELAKGLSGKIPVIYSSGVYEPIASRFCQQLNENSKMLCWYNKFPALNHNEIVGWTEKNDKLAVVFFNCQEDYYRTKARYEFTKKVVSEYAGTVSEIFIKGSNAIERSLYLVHLTDWISVKIAEIDNTDPIEIRVIDALKDELATLN